MSAAMHSTGSNTTVTRMNWTTYFAKGRPERSLPGVVLNAESLDGIAALRARTPVAIFIADRFNQTMPYKKVEPSLHEMLFGARRAAELGDRDGGTRGTQHLPQ